MFRSRIQEDDHLSDFEVQFFGESCFLSGFLLNLCMVRILITDWKMTDLMDSTFLQFPDILMISLIV